MDTQLVRLDAPYNIICGTDGRFALHIATLIVVKEAGEAKSSEIPMSNNLSVATYPVVSEKHEARGQVWMNTELKDCYVVCEQGCKSLMLRDLKMIMEYCARNQVYHYRELIPMRFNFVMLQYGLEIDLPKDKKDKTISDYIVCLEFEENNNGKTCMAYAEGVSQFYFYEFFANDPDLFGELQTNNEAIKSMAELRDDYLRLFRAEGLRSITFTTKNNQYQWFVDELNNHKADGKKV